MPDKKSRSNSIAPNAKGDLVIGTGSAASGVVTVGANGTVLTADSTQTSGVKWSAAAVDSWTRRLSVDSITFNCIAYNGSNLYVAAGESGTLYTSPDGQTWTSRTSGFGAESIYDVHYASGLSLWIAVGTNGVLTTSSDGTTWTARTSNMSTNQINAVWSSGTTVVAVGRGGGTTNTGGIIYSTDGTTWTRKSQSVTVGDSYFDVTYNGTNWLVVGTSSTNNAIYASTPSGTWTALAIGGANTAAFCAYDGTATIVVLQQGTPYYTTSTTYASAASKLPNLTNSTNYIFQEGKQRINYASGKIYWFTYTSTSYPVVMGELSTGISGENWSDYKPFAFPPASGFNKLPSAIFVGTAGKIIGAAGSIYTSF